MITVISKNVTNSKFFDSDYSDSKSKFNELDKIFKKSQNYDTLEEYNKFKNKKKMIEKMKRP